MVGEFVPPSWARLVIVGGDAAYGSKANMRMVQDRDTADPARRWSFVFAIARTWKTVEKKSLQNLVTGLPPKAGHRRRDFSGDRFPICLRACRHRSTSCLCPGS